MQLNKVGTVFDRARALLNDQIGANFTNAVLQPYFDMVYDEIRQDCEDNNITLTNATSDAINVVQGMTDIGGPTGPALPNDFIEPIELWENPGASSTDYVLMARRIFLPKTSVISSYLGVYQFNGGFLKFLGATGNVSVKIDYVALGLPDAIDENTVLKVRNMMLFLAQKTAAYASMFIGENETRASALNDLSVASKDTFLSISLKSSQNAPVRKRPFMGRYKRLGGFYGGY